MSRFTVCAGIALASTLVSSLALATEPLASITPVVQSGATVSDQAETPTLFGSGARKVRIGGYGAPSIGITTINGHAAFDLGARGALVLNDRFGIGLAGAVMGWDGDRGENPGLSNQRELIGGYGGLLLEYRIVPQFPIHGRIDTIIGGGVVCTSLEQSFDDDGHEGRDCDRSRGFAMVEPTANVEMNLTRFMRLSVGGGYRFAFAREKNGIDG